MVSGINGNNGTYVNNGDNGTYVNNGNNGNNRITGNNLPINNGGISNSLFSNNIAYM